MHFAQQAYKFIWTGPISGQHIIHGPQALVLNKGQVKSVQISSRVCPGRG